MDLDTIITLVIEEKSKIPHINSAKQIASFLSMSNVSFALDWQIHRFLCSCSSKVRGRLILVCIANSEFDSKLWGGILLEGGIILDSHQYGGIVIIFQNS